MTPPLNRRDFLAQATATAALAATAAASTARSAARPRQERAFPRARPTRSPWARPASRSRWSAWAPAASARARRATRPGWASRASPGSSATRSTSGVCFFDVADQYGSHVYLREALKGVPRDQYVIQTKTHATNVADARSHLERYRLELGVDYIDIVLLHCMQKDGWPAENQGSMEYLMKAKEEKIIRAHGTSCHGMDPLRTSAKNPFVEVDLARINPEGLIMDDKKPDEVASVLEEMHNAGKGVIGMKILGEGRIKTPERKDASLRYVLGLGTVNAFIIGFESTEQVDDILKRTADAIAFLKG